MSPTMSPLASRLLPVVDAWFDIVASLLGAQRSITYAVLAQSEPAQPARHVASVPDGWRDTPA